MLLVQQKSDLSRKDAMKLGSREIYVWVGNDTLMPCAGAAQGQLCFPLVTGLQCKNDNDELFNIANIVSDEVSRTLNKKKNGWWTRIKMWLMKLMSKRARKESLELSNVLRDSKSVYVTHTELNKDHGNHPLHLLASQCSMDMSRQFGKAMLPLLTGQLTDMSSVDVLVSQVITHPFHVPPQGHLHSTCMRRIKYWLSDDANANRIAMLSYHNALTGRNRIQVEDKTANFNNARNLQTPLAPL